MTSGSTYAEIAEFAADLVNSALVELSAGFTELVTQVRADDALCEQLHSEGAQAVLAGQGPLVLDLQKNNREFVTAAEERAEKAMRDRVAATFPTHGIIGEELGTTAGDEWIWVFDPVDGTSAMIRTAFAQACELDLGEPAPGFGVTIAVVHDNEAVVGVVAELETDGEGLRSRNVWVGVMGAGTTRNGIPVMMPSHPELADVRIASTVPEVMFDSREKWSSFQALQEHTSGVVRDQNCVGYMRLLTEDPVSIAIERDLTLPDAAALVPVLRAAGITVSDADGHPCRFDQSSREQEYTILAAPPALHHAALAVLRAGVSEDSNQSRPLDGPSNGYPKKFT